MTQGMDVTAAAAPEAKVRDLGKVLLLARIGAGLATSSVAVGALARTWVEHRATTWWCVGSAALLTGAYLVLSGLREILAPREPTRDAQSDDPEADAGDEPDVLVPMLGALLAYKFQVIKEWQLQRALRMQRRERKRRRLGDILLEMRWVTPGQLHRAVEYQRAQAKQRGAKLSRSIGLSTARREHQADRPQPTSTR